MSLSSLLSSKHTNTQTRMQTPAHTFYMATHKNCRHITYYLPLLASNFRFAFIFGCFFSCFQVLNNLSAAKWQRILFHSRNAENGRTKHQIDFNAI